MLYGVRKLWYYIRMARHMTGGLSVLFIAIIALDVGLYAIAVIDNLKLALALYLIAYNALTEFLTIARGVESKLFRAPLVSNIVLGLVSLALAVLCNVLRSRWNPHLGFLRRPILRCGRTFDFGLQAHRDHFLT